MVNLTYSETVYLFADKFISDRAKFVNFDSHPSGQKIPVAKLAQQMVTAAVVQLTDEQNIELLAKDVKKLFILPGKDVFAKKMQGGGDKLTGIESALFDNIQEETRLKSVVYNLLANDEVSPWGQIVLISKKSMADKGVLKLEEKAKSIFSAKKYLYDPAILSQYNLQREKIEKAFSDFEKQTQISKLVYSAIQSGMAARREQSSTDD